MEDTSTSLDGLKSKMETKRKRINEIERQHQKSFDLNNRGKKRL
jgi:hypothetical protein